MAPKDAHRISKSLTHADHRWTLGTVQTVEGAVRGRRESALYGGFRPPFVCPGVVLTLPGSVPGAARDGDIWMVELPGSLNLGSGGGVYTSPRFTRSHSCFRMV